MNLPTDKLYKFISIAGVALVIYGVTLPWQHYDKAERQRIEFLEVAEKSLRLMEDHMSTMDKQVRLLEKLSNLEKDERDPDDHKKIIDLDIEIENSRNMYNEQAIIARKNQRLYSHDSTMHNIWSWLSIISVIIGFVMAFIGFKIWHRNDKS